MSTHSWSQQKQMKDEGGRRHLMQNLKSLRHMTDDCADD